MTTSRTPGRAFLSGLYFIYQWLVYIPLVALATLVGGIAAIIVALLISPRAANLGVGVMWGRVLAWLAPVRVDMEGLENIDPDKSYVVVANHQSQFDIPVVYGWIGLDLRWVAKAELGKIPFLGTGSRAVGHVFIDRSDPEQARAAIGRAVKKLGPGSGLLFFAEGTRSRSGKLLPFKKGAFRIAVDQQLPVLPVTLVNARDILPAGSLRIRPGRVRVVVHPPLPTEGLERGQSGALRQQCRDVIAGALPPELQS